MAKEKMLENNKLVNDRVFKNLGRFSTGQIISWKLSKGDETNLGEGSETSANTDEKCMCW